MSGTPSRRGRLVVVSGPSGVGKDTVLREAFAIASELRRSVSYTTRRPRPGEVDGVDYSFVEEAAFREMAARGDFLEHACVHGHLYGTSRRRVEEALARGDDVVLKIDVQGADLVRRTAPDALFIFLLPPSEEELRRRRHSRGTEGAADLARRQADSADELSRAAAYDHRVVNDDVGRAAREIVDIVARARAR